MNTSGTTIKKAIKEGTMSVLSQKSARIIKEATGVALTIFIMGENKVYKKLNLEQSAESKIAVATANKNPSRIFPMEFKV